MLNFLFSCSEGCDVNIAIIIIAIIINFGYFVKNIVWSKDNCSQVVCCGDPIHRCRYKKVTLHVITHVIIKEIMHLIQNVVGILGIAQSTKRSLCTKKVVGTLDIT